MICLMHEAAPYGHLMVHGQPPNEAQLASLTGIPAAELPHLVAELERLGVFSRTKEGVIYSRKLVRMAAKSAKARKTGKLGGNPTLGNGTGKGQSVNPPLKGDDMPQSPETRDQREEKDEPDGSSKKKAARAKGSRLPADWRLPRDWGEWASAQGLDEVSTRREAEKFADYWRAKAGREAVKLDWGATWRNWVRKAVEARPSRPPSAGPARVGERRTGTDGRVREYAGAIDGWVEVRG